MLSEWLYVGVFFLIAMFLPAAAIFIAGILAPKKTQPHKKFHLRMRDRDRRPFLDSIQGAVLHLHSGFPGVRCRSGIALPVGGCLPSIAALCGG